MPADNDDDQALLDLLQNSVVLLRRIQATMDQATERLREAQMPADAVALQDAAKDLGRVRRALAARADRDLTVTQPINTEDER